MPQSPASRRESSEAFEVNEAEGPAGTPADKAPARLSLSQYLTALASYGDGSVSAGVALDLVLNDIVKRACLATNASAGAIAIAENEEMVCRATTGENAPDLGTRLDTNHGLSGACVRTKVWQRCNDTENDSRVNAALCRQLGVRSILVAPVLNGDKLVGIIEIFSVRPDAFGDRETEALRASSQEVTQNLQHAAEAESSTSSSPPQTAEPNPERTKFSELLTMTPVANSADVATQTTEVRPAKDITTTALLICVVLLALIVGWLFGRSEWRHGPGKASVAAKQVLAKPQEAPADSQVPVEEPVTASPSAPLAEPKITGTGSTDGGLVVTRDGKVIFRTPPQPANHKSASSNDLVNHVRLSPQTAEQYLIKRVEPDYPDQARKDQVQGPVVFEALVASDGSVAKLTPVSGNPELVQAATQAVQQWRFRPFLDKGQPQPFATQITVVFRLP